MAASHQPELVELPVLVAVGTEPLTRVVVPFVGEAHRDPCAFERPDFLDESIVELLRPLALEELDDGRAPGKELCAITPRAIYRVCQRDALRVARVPGILGGARLLCRRVARERRKRRAS